MADKDTVTIKRTEGDERENMSHSNMKQTVTHHVYPKKGVAIELLPPTWNDKREIEALPRWLGTHLLEAFMLFEEHVKKFGEFAKKPIRITIAAADKHK